MRFAIAAVALAGAVFAAEEAESTVYSTEFYTITSCAPTVTNCPASSTVVSSSVRPMTTSTIYATNTVTNCPDTVSHCPSESTVTETVAVSTTVCPVEEASSTETSSPAETTESSSPAETSEASSGSVIPPPAPTSAAPAPECPTISVKTIKTSVTTVIPTIIYETQTVPCPTTTATPSGMPTSTKPAQPTYTAGAATLGGSVFFAAAAGVLALLA